MIFFVCQVKQAALECISVISYNYGNGKINTLLKIVEQAPKGDSTNNIPDLVQARLSKHRLPHVDDLGNVVYVTDNDKFSSQRKHSFIDLENSSSDNSPISSANRKLSFISSFVTCYLTHSSYLFKHNQ